MIEAAFDALVEIGDAAEAYVSQGLQHDNEAVRRECRGILNAFKDENRDGRIWSGLHDENVRSGATS